MRATIVRIETPKNILIEDQTQATIGVLIVDGKILCYTLEPPDRNNGKDSCIPVGIYKCEPYSSARFPNVWEIKDVPNRTYILFHKGNTEKDSLGCILIGKQVGYLNQARAVLQSTAAYNEMFAVLGNKSFDIQIKNI